MLHSFAIYYLEIENKLQIHIYYFRKFRREWSIYNFCNHIFTTVFFSFSVILCRCDCGNCVPMPTAIESKCCHYYAALREKMEEGEELLDCITNAWWVCSQLPEQTCLAVGIIGICPPRRTTGWQRTNSWVSKMLIVCFYTELLVDGPYNYCSINNQPLYFLWKKMQLYLLQGLHKWRYCIL